jgi:ammonium transporter, Amt family
MITAPWASVVIGVIAGLACSSAIEFKKSITNLDDTLDTFSVHGVGGFIGNILTGFFAEKWIGALDGTSINGGAIEGNWYRTHMQLDANLTD